MMNRLLAISVVGLLAVGEGVAAPPNATSYAIDQDPQAPVAPAPRDVNAVQAAGLVWSDESPRQDHEPRASGHDELQAPRVPEILEPTLGVTESPLHT